MHDRSIEFLRAEFVAQTASQSDSFIAGPLADAITRQEVLTRQHSLPAHAIRWFVPSRTLGS